MAEGISIVSWYIDGQHLSKLAHRFPEEEKVVTTLHAIILNFNENTMVPLGITFHMYSFDEEGRILAELL